MKNITTKIFVIAYVIILLIPAYFTFVDAKKDIVNTENRELAAFPVIKTEEGYNTAYFRELDDWLSDHIGLRSQMIKLNTAMHLNLFNDSPEESIVLGSDGWLYYDDTIKDYLNIATFSEKNAKNVAVTIKMMQDYVESKGGKFVFTVAPNKNTIYSQNMPYYYIAVPGNGNLELIEKAIKEEGVNYADIRTAFVNNYNETGEILYQTTDSHWNYKGALLGYHTILESLGLSDNIFDNAGFVERYDWEGDLAKMLYGDSLQLDRQLYADYEFTYKITSKDKKVDALRLSTSSDIGSDRALIFRDSFYNTMQVFFAERFEKVMFSRAVPYNLTLMNSVDANVVILEIVERNIPNLVTKAPFMEAPKVYRNINETDAKIIVIDDAGNIYTPAYTMYQEESNGLTHLYGTIDEEISGDIYYVGDEVTESGQALYKAFPIFEQKLLESDELQDNGFSLYL